MIILDSGLLFLATVYVYYGIMYNIIRKSDSYYLFSTLPYLAMGLHLFNEVVRIKINTTK